MINQIDFSKIKGLLTDIDGTLYFKGNVIKGAIEAVQKLREAGLKILFLTNTDSKSPKTILNLLIDYGFSLSENDIFTPVIALKDYLSKYPSKKSYFLTTKEVDKEFQDFPRIRGSESPDFVIIGDFYDNWDLHRLNLAFKYVLKGATLLGMQGNKYYLDRNGEPVIDTGSFVQMVATAAKVSPKIFGKPSREYFIHALNKINLNSDETLVIGDDLESDIQGAINAGIKGILVKTGKGQYYESTVNKIEPHAVLNSFSSILDLI